MPYIGSFEFSGYRGFNDPVVIEPARPQKGQLGSGLTVLVGPNNAGKSSLLEAMELTARASPVSLGRNLRHDATEYQAKFQLQWSDGTTTMMSSALNGQDIQLDSQSTGRREQRTIAFVPSTRDIPLSVSGTRSATEFNNAQPHAFQRQHLPDRLQSRISYWRQRQDEFLNLVGRVIDFKFRIYQEGTTLHVKVHTHEHDPRGLGRGVLSVLNILDAIWDAPAESTVLIDEPEAALHPYYQRRLCEVLMDFSQRIQIIYSTHSPYFVSWAALNSGACLYRASRPQGGYCCLHALKRATIDRLANLGGFQNPHVLGLNALEVFFLQDRVILTEGQDDVVYFREMARLRSTTINGDFYGWGAGGADNFDRLLQLFQDLGFHKVVGIVDNNRRNILDDLQRRFPDFRFLSLPTNDVRDKLQDGNEIQGLCRRDGTIHEHQIEYVDRLFAKINEILT